MQIEEASTYLLAGKDGNRLAIDWLVNNPLELRNVTTGTLFNGHSHKHKHIVIIGTAWDPNTSLAIGTAKMTNRDRELIVVFHDSSTSEISKKMNSWYADNIFLLEGRSRALVELVGEVPIQLEFNENGEMEKVVNGI